MKNGRAELRFDVVADERQIFVRETFCPNRIAGDENGNVIDETEPGFERATGVEASRFVGTDGEIIDHHFRGGVPQFFDDFLAGGFFFQGQEGAERVLVGHVRSVAVENAAHFHDRAGELDLVAKNLGAIGGRKDGLAHVEPDLAPVDVERGHDFDIARPIRPDLAVHEADAGAIRGGAVVKGAPTKMQCTLGICRSRS